MCVFCHFDRINGKYTSNFWKLGHINIRLFWIIYNYILKTNTTNIKMFKNLYQLRNKVTSQVTNQASLLKSSKRFFQYNNMGGGPTQKANYLSYGLMGAGTAGIVYLMLYGRRQNSAY